MRYGFLFVLLSVFFLRCAQDTKAPEEKVTVRPEKILLQWQKWVDEGKLDSAATLSTEAARHFLDDLRDMPEDSTAFGLTVIQKLKCTISGDTAVCNYVIVEDDEKLPMTTYLVKKDSFWLVDVADDEENLEE